MRHVHFAPANSILSSSPSTPSPTLSTSSLTSLSDPPTPPPFVITPMFYPRPLTDPKPNPVPETISGEMHIHYLLAFTPYKDPIVHYDLSLPPYSLEEEISADDFAEPATHPPLPKLHVICPHLQWSIHISSSSGPAGFVTVFDVFDSIYRALRMPVHPTEYRQLLSPDAAVEVNRAYYRRCGRVEDVEFRRLEESKGVKRIDFLMGRNRFMGLSGTLKGPDIWELNVAWTAWLLALYAHALIARRHHDFQVRSN